MTTSNSQLTDREKPPMMAQKTVILVSQPGITHNTLAGVLSSFACIKVVSAAGALSTLALLPQVSPDSVVIDANLPHEETLALLGYLKRLSAHIRCVVLTTTFKHHRALRSAGADVLLLDNCSASQLETAVCEAGA